MGCDNTQASLCNPSYEGKDFLNVVPARDFLNVVPASAYILKSVENRPLLTLYYILNHIFAGVLFMMMFRLDLLM